MARCEPNAAIAKEDGGNAVPGGWGEARAPGDLRIVVGMDIDKAGRDQFAPCIDFFHTAGKVLADGRDPIAGDGDIGFERFSTVAVDNGAITDNQIR